MLYFFVFLLAFFITYLFTPLAGKIALFLGAVDHPGERKVHFKSTPRMGGLAIYIAFLFSLLISIVFLVNRGFSRLIPYQEMISITLGATVALLVGLSDDLRSLSPKEKFIGQALAATTLIFLGTKIDFLNIPYLGIVSLGYWSYFITFFWVIAFMNIVNLIDGLDGLAAGVSVIASLTFFVASYRMGQFFTALICLALAGACAGFLRYNFYPAKIFMGDTGSLLLGFLLGAITVQGVMKTLAATAFLLPLIVMAIPIIDTALAIFRRVKRKKPISEPDREHIHHRFLERGFSQRRAVLFIYLWTAILSVVALSFRFVTFSPLFWGSLLVLLIISLVISYFLGLFDVILGRK